MLSEVVDRQQFTKALAGLANNNRQAEAINQNGHCVVIAGPGSGKTKTLTVAMARTLLEEVEPPRGIACITYNNECVLELQSRLNQLGIEPSAQVFIGTAHSFAMTQVVTPYARCTLPGLPSQFDVASKEQCKIAIETAYQKEIGGADNPHKRWRFAEEKRRKDVLRKCPSWRGTNSELADFIEAYETELRRSGLIDFDDMLLLGLRIVHENTWVRNALRAKFPILYVDEYQDLGTALHMLVDFLCFKSGIRLFAVGDSDQSMYQFTGADPSLLNSLVERDDVHAVKLQFNYRCGRKIIDASMAALGEEREYKGPDGAADGVLNFHGVHGDSNAHATYVFDKILPKLQKTIPLDEIAILYRAAKHGVPIVNEARQRGIPITQSDNTALVQRNSHMSRFIEACARWASGGWIKAEPRFSRLVGDAATLVYGSLLSDQEYAILQSELIRFLRSTIDSNMSAHEWLIEFRKEVLLAWQSRATTVTERWDDIDSMITKTDPIETNNKDMPLAHLGGRIEGSGRLNLSTLHSAKGREFEAVIMFGMNDDVLPNKFDIKNEAQLREARRIFYVGVTRAKSSVEFVYKANARSKFISDIYQRVLAQGW